MNVGRGSGIGLDATPSIALYPQADSPLVEQKVARMSMNQANLQNMLPIVFNIKPKDRCITYS